jgi:hypothetical protein
MSLIRRVERLEAVTSEPLISSAEAEMIRERMKTKIPRLIESADRGDDHSLRLLFAYCPSMEKQVVEWAGAGNEEAAALLVRLRRAVRRDRHCWPFAFLRKGHSLFSSSLRLS